MKKILLIMFCMIFLIGTVSAFEFDNVKDYNEETKTITVKNSLLGIDWLSYGEVATIQLLSEQHRRIIPGDYVFEMKFNLENPYFKAVKNVKFFKKDTMELINNPNFQLKYYDPNSVYDETVYEYSECEEQINKSILCNYNLIGTHNEKRQGQWLELNSLGDLKVGETIIRGYYPDLEQGEIIEWIPNLFGVEINEWADFGSATRFEWQTSNNNWFDSPTNFALTQNFTVGTVGPNENFTIKGVSLNVFRTGSPGIALITIEGNSGSGPNGTIFSTGEIDVDALGTGTGGAWNNYTMSDVVLKESTTYSIVIYIGPSNDGSNHFGWRMFNTGATYTGGILSQKPDNGTSGSWVPLGNRDTAFEVWGITFIPAPSVTLNSPVDAFNSSSQTINFNGTVTSPAGIINVTLSIDGVLNETNSSGVNDTDYLFTKIIAEGNHNWTYESCNVNGCTTATTRTFTIDTAPIINVFSPTNNSNSSISTIYYNQKWLLLNL